MKKNETGRSMVEMLGVLAIIGVLSIGGVYGYTVAMRRHRANEIVSTASMLAMMAQSADNGEGGGCVQLSTSILPKTPGGLNLDIVAAEMGGVLTVSIKFPESDEALCNAIQNLAGYDCGTTFTIPECSNSDSE